MDFLRAVKKAPAEVLSPEHPYYPLNAEIAGFIANDKSALLLLSTFAAILVVISSVAVLLAKRINGRLTSADTWALNWFILCSLSSVDCTQGCH